METYLLMPGLLNDKYMLTKPVMVEYEDKGILGFYMIYKYKSYEGRVLGGGSDIYDAERLLRSRLAWDFLYYSTLEKLSSARPDQLEMKKELSDFIARCS